jgi:2-polyprenyl-6-hydroxyphenyl methylase/3-demethylubiquinone-9 3-methyltransferase
MARATAPKSVNNRVYDVLDERWYDAQDDPIALLRAESSARNPWVAHEIRTRFDRTAPRVLDVGCGGGFLSNALASAGFEVTGIDTSSASLAVAARHDATRSVRYVAGDALSLPFADQSFDVACAMDFLEHVEEPDRVVAEVSRVLLPGGLFFFHTFDRTFLSWLLVIKGVEWFVRNVPRNLHVWRLFVRPSELAAMCAAHGMQVRTIRGLEPVMGARVLAELLFTGRVPRDFQFQFTDAVRTGYVGVAAKVPFPPGAS